MSMAELDVGFEEFSVLITIQKQWHHMSSL
jgi:hypothetical protein